MRINKCWCGSEEYEKYSYFRKGFIKDFSRKIKLVKCTKCHTVRMFDNGLSSEPQYVGSYHYKKVSPRNSETVRLVNRYASGNSLIDVGCNTGILLNEIKNRCEGIDTLKGIDIDKEAIEFGLGYFNLDLEPIDIMNENSTYDNVVTCHTLEHVESLGHFFADIDRILNKGGKLFISIPNIDSMSAKHSLRLWNALSPDYHIWYFNMKSLEYCVKHYLPEYEVVNESSFFIWKPFVFPSMLWQKLSVGEKSVIKRWETNLKGDQIDLVLKKR